MSSTKQEKQPELFGCVDAFLGTAVMMLGWPLVWFALASVHNWLGLDWHPLGIFGLSLLLTALCAWPASSVLKRLWPKRDYEDTPSD